MRRGWAPLQLAITSISLTIPLTANAGDVVSENETNPYPGVRIVERVEANPNNRIWVAYISLCTQQVHVTATAAPTSFQTPGTWGGNQGVQLAVNGDFFTSGPQVYGDAVGGGVPWPLAQTGNSQPDGWYHGRYGWIAFGPDWVEFSHTQRTKTTDAETFDISLGWHPTQETTEIPPGTLALVSGFPELVIEGQQYTCTSPTDGSCFPDRSDMRDRHPRTAMGLTQDRQTFILVTVDGRDSPSSVGMYGSELAALMADLGAWQAFNLDGGGSTAMWLQDAGYLNQPSDGSARAVANHWGIFAGDAGGQAAEPGSCFVPGGCYPTALAGAQDEPFADMPPGSLGHDEAIALLDADIVQGCQTEPQRMFCPHCTLTRRVTAGILAKAAGLDLSSPPATPTFVDVPADDTFYAAVEAVYAAGFMPGCTATSFCPSQAPTRGELAGIVRLAAGWDPAQPQSGTFDDLDPAHPSFADVESLAEHCIASECEPGQFCPDRAANRAEGAVFITHALGLVPAACEPPDPGGTTSGGMATTGADDGSSSGSPNDDGGHDPESDTSGSTGSVTGDLAETDDTGCGCRTSTPAGAVPLWLALPLLALRRRP